MRWTDSLKADIALPYEIGTAESRVRKRKLPPELRKDAKREEKPETIAKAIEKINAGRQAEDERVKASQMFFFMDGASNLLSNIAKMFAFHPYRVIVDWYHLKKRRQEYLSISFKSKEEKKRTLQKFLRILWPET